MSVSVSVQFTGQLDGPKHREVVAEIKGAIEGVLAANGISVTLSASEQEQTTKTASFPSLDLSTVPASSTRIVNMYAGFHVDEAPASPVAEAPAPTESAPTEAAASSSETAQTEAAAPTTAGDTTAPASN